MRPAVRGPEPAWRPRQTDRPRSQLSGASVNLKRGCCLPRSPAAGILGARDFVSLLTTVIENKLEVRPRSYTLLVIGPDVLANHPLPASGVVAIGRAENADVRLTDPMASRMHARLHVGQGGTLEIEDLGSINQTRIREVALSPGERIAIAPGEAVTIGSTILMVQESRNFTRPRRLWPHEYFEARLEEEVARSQATRAPFAVVRLHVDRDPGPAALVDTVGPGLRLPDMLAIYGPGEYEILLPNTPPELAAAITQNLVERLGASGVAARAGSARYPRDAFTPELLLALACDRVRGAPAGEGAGAPAVVLVDPAMRRVHQLAERAAAGNINVLIVGETGVGKEIMAEAVHRHSPRAKAPFLGLNCAAFTENLLESELYGHERGAFTGATAAKPGLLETAPGGTVFLDEISELSLGLQAKLLRVIETRQVTRVGGIKPRPIDVRFVAATNRNLQAEVAEGRFRIDLYYRLNGITLQIPPLRERPSEVLPLARAFVTQLAAQIGREPAPTLTAEAEDLLVGYAWPGNIRELRNVMERAVLLSVGGEISEEHLPVETMTTNCPLLPRFSAEWVAAAAPGPAGSDAGGGDPASGERERIMRALAACAGNQSRAAKLLGMARSTLVLKLNAYQLPRPRRAG
jgi:two-component system, NtrC family, response regulator AtoC